MIIRVTNPILRIHIALICRLQIPVKCFLLIFLYTNALAIAIT